MFEPSSEADADAVERVDLQPRNPTYLGSTQPTPSTATDPSQAHCFQQALDELAELDNRQPLSRSSDSRHRSVTSFISSNQIDCLDFEADLTLSTLSPVNVTMSSPDQPIFDGHGHDDSDYDDMVSSQSSDAYSPAFNPSLPSLVSRVHTPDQTEPDMLSLSGDTVSNADTVSDRFDGQEDCDRFDAPEDSEGSYEQIRLEDIPVELRETPSQESEDLDQIIMSDHTIVPPAPAATANYFGRATNFEPIPAPFSDKGPYRIMGFTEDDKPYSLPTCPLRLLFVADESIKREAKFQILFKIVGAVAPNFRPWHKIEKVSDSTDESTTQPFSEGYDYIISENTTIAVRIVHLVAYNAERKLGTSSDGCFLDFEAGPLPHFTILYHGSSDRESRPPYGERAQQITKAIAQHGIPVLEISFHYDEPLWTNPIMSSPTGLAVRDNNILHVRKALRWNSDGTPTNLEPRQFCIPIDVFIVQLESVDLGRHLGYISSQGRLISSDSSAKRPERYMAKSRFHYLKMLFIILTPLYMLFAVMYSGMTTNIDPMSDLTLRQEALSMALNKSVIAPVDVTSILHYPTTTGVSAGTTTIGVAFPTAVNVHVARSDQLFVALPKDYRPSAYIGLFRNDKNAVDYNATKLIDGVYVLNLKPADAYGQVSIDFRSTVDPSINETVKVYLGNRLTHRATYEKAARHVQHDFQRDVEEAQTMARALQSAVVNNTHLALNVSAHRARALRSRLFNTASTAAQRVSLGCHGAMNHTTNLVKHAGALLTHEMGKEIQRVRDITSFAKNTTSSIGSALTEKVPSKDDFAHARSNSIRLKEKLLNKRVLQTPKDCPPESILVRIKSLSDEVRQRFSSMLSAFETPGRLVRDEKRPGQPGKDVGAAVAKPQQKALLKRSTVKLEDMCAKHPNTSICRNKNPLAKEKSTVNRRKIFTPLDETEVTTERK